MGELTDPCLMCVKRKIVRTVGPMTLACEGCELPELRARVAELEAELDRLEQINKIVRDANGRILQPAEYRLANRIADAETYLDEWKARADRLAAVVEGVREFDPASAITALVSTYYADHHTDESWEALCNLADEIRALTATPEPATDEGDDECYEADKKAGGIA